MTLRPLRLALPLLATALLLPSCAYMQTNKSVKEMGRSYPGYQLDHLSQIYRSGNTWYVAATPAQYRLSYDVLHDNVFRKTNEPSMTLQRVETGSLAYHEISADTATVLLRADGYVESQALAREIAESSAPWLPALPDASAHAIKAHLDGTTHAPVTYSPTPAEVPWYYRVLAGLDFVVVDIPGTVVYNVAVPLIAPFVFYYEFIQEQ